MMFFRRRAEKNSYDRENLKPVVRSSICTGEKVAGFQDVRTGKFTEVMLLRKPGDLERFRRDYGIAENEIATEY